MDSIGKSLGIQKLEDWYPIDRIQILKRTGGNILLGYYSRSLIKALEGIYPEYHWQPWRFENRLPRGYWNERVNVTAFMNWIAKQVGVESMDDWYNISVAQVIVCGGMFHYYIYSIYSICLY